MRDKEKLEKIKWKATKMIKATEYLPWVAPEETEVI